MSRWVRSAVRAIAMALGAFVLTHNVIFLAGYRQAFGAAMASTGHDHGWTIGALASLTLAGSFLLAAARRLHELRHLAKEAAAPTVPTEPGRRAFLQRWLTSWVALAVATAILFVLEENAEAAHIHAALPGIGVLASAAYPNAVVIIAAVALGVSLVAAILGWRSSILIARIEAARAAVSPRSPLTFPTPEGIARRLGSILGRRHAGRAPPALAV
jgi:hypothetical protein